MPCNKPRAAQGEGYVTAKQSEAGYVRHSFYDSYRGNKIVGGVGSRKAQPLEMFVTLAETRQSVCFVSSSSTAFCKLFAVLFPLRPPVDDDLLVSS